MPVDEVVPLAAAGRVETDQQVEDYWIGKVVQFRTTTVSQQTQQIAHPEEDLEKESKSLRDAKYWNDPNCQGLRAAVGESSHTVPLTAGKRKRDGTPAGVAGMATVVDNNKSDN